MVNLLLTSVMIAALCGMVFCNRKHKKGTYYQIAALILLVLVLISGGMFMCRLDSMGFFGLDNIDEQRAANDQKYVESKAHVISNYIKNNRPGKKKVLLIIDKANNNLGGFITSKLGDMNVKNVVKEVLVHASQENDEMISESGLAAAEAASIDEAWNKHKDAIRVIIAGFSPSGKALEEVKNFKTLQPGKVQVILVASGGLSRWMYEKIDDGVLEAVIVIDPALVPPAELPENINEVFRSRYTLINKSNLERNKRFLH